MAVIVINKVRKSGGYKKMRVEVRTFCPHAVEAERRDGIKAARAAQAKIAAKAAKVTEPTQVVDVAEKKRTVVSKQFQSDLSIRPTVHSRQSSVRHGPMSPDMKSGEFSRRESKEYYLWHRRMGGRKGPKSSWKDGRRHQTRKNWGPKAMLVSLST